MECIVLAGGTPRPGEPLYEFTRGRPKALLPIGGRPMIEHVLAALRGCAAIGRILVVGVVPEDGFVPPPNVRVMSGRGGLADNLYAAIDALDSAPEEPVAYCWSDIPLARSEHFARFIAEAPPRFDVCAGLVPRACLQRAYPAFDDTWLRLADGEYVAADFGLFRRRHASRLRAQIERLAPLRKSAVRQAMAVGLPLLVGYLSGRLTRGCLTRSLSRRYGIECVVRVVEQPELGLDVDRPQDLRLVRRVVERRGRATASGAVSPAPS